MLMELQLSNRGTTSVVLGEDSNLTLHLART
jgi:hypothetical protein